MLPGLPIYMNPTDLDLHIHTGPQRTAPMQPRSLLASPAALTACLQPASIEDAIARALIAVGGGVATGAIARCMAWGPEAIALALLLALALVMGFGFLHRCDRRLALGMGAYALLGAIGSLLAIGFGG